MWRVSSPADVAAAAPTCKGNLKKISVINNKKEKKTYQQLETCRVSSPADVAAAATAATADATAALPLRCVKGI